MSEFDSTSTASDFYTAETTIDLYKLTGPPQVLPIISAILVVLALAISLISADSTIAFGLSVASCIAALTSRAQNQARMNQPTYSRARWFGVVSTSVYVVASLISLTQIVMVAYVAGR